VDAAAAPADRALSYGLEATRTMVLIIPRDPRLAQGESVIK
jgi:hypothetical protein